MLVCQSKNTFVRNHGDYAYIVNQLTNSDLVVNETGADFLKEISRDPQDIETIVNRLFKLYDNSVEKSELQKDFEYFCSELFEQKYLVLGETEDEIRNKDVDFNYQLLNSQEPISQYSIGINKEEKNTTDFWISRTQFGEFQLNDIQFELTSTCNERCIHCYIPNARKNLGHDITYDDFCNVIDQFVEMGGIHVGLSGGECLTHKHILNIIDYCRKKDLIITILSNLIALRDEQIPFLKQANIAHIQTSLYSMDAAIHDKITSIKGSWGKTKNAIEKLVDANIPVQISCPLMNANKDSFVDVLKYAESLHTIATTDYILMAEANWDTDNLAHRLSVNDVEKAMRSVLEYKLQKGESFQNSGLSKDINDNEIIKSHPACGAGLNSLCVLSSGDVCACPGWNGMVCGNIHKQSLKRIWEESEQLNKIRKTTKSDFLQCLECEARDYCTLCLVRNFNESGGDMFKINQHFCDVAFANKKIVEEFQNKTTI
jgi:radical SAM protein with 4Fe4S-binding SPASM domain